MKKETTAELSTGEVLQRYFAATRLVEKEYAGEVLPVQGTLPDELQGTLFRNGNGRFEHQGIAYDHLFDGDGMPVSFRFADGRVEYRNRYVRTREFVAEERAGRMLYRSFGTDKPGGILANLGRMRFKNASNTNIIRHGGRLLSLWEGGLPHELDPETLETRQRFDYGGVLQNPFGILDRLINPELPFSAHPKIHPGTGVLHNFGTLAGTTQRLLLYEVQPDGQAAITREIPLPQLYFTHDFVLTDTGYRIFFLVPVAFDVLRAFMGLRSPVGSIRVDRDRPTRVLLVDPEGELTYLDSPFSFIFHFVNGYQPDPDTLVVDALTLPDFPSAESNRRLIRGEVNDSLKGQLWRYRIRLDRSEVKRERISDFGAELPKTHPQRQGKPYQYFWGIASPGTPDRPILDGLAKFDVEEGKVVFRDLQGALPGEPVFVPRPGSEEEDDGWLLYLIFRAATQRTELVVADAGSLETLATAALPHNIPLGFHGFWDPKG